MSKQPLIEQIDAILPQTQCGQCGYGGCAPYARAIVLEGAAINRCPPGGEQTLAKISELTGQQATTIDPECGVTQPAQVAKINEQECIGCTKCITACPVDAIIGTSKMMHDVITDFCTGCGLCIAPCPVDCITLEPVPKDFQGYRSHDLMQTKAAKARYLHKTNLETRRKNELLQSRAKLKAENSKQDKLALIQAARARVLAKKKPEHQGSG